MDTVSNMLSEEIKEEIEEEKIDIETHFLSAVSTSDSLVTKSSQPRSSMPKSSISESSLGRKRLEFDAFRFSDDDEDFESENPSRASTPTCIINNHKRIRYLLHRNKKI